MNDIRNILGLDDTQNAFQKHWLDYGFGKMNMDGMLGKTTISVQEMMANPENKKKAAGLVDKGIEKVFGNKVEAKSVDATLMQDSIPIQFDPEITQILTTEAPLMAQVPSRGWQGYSVSSNRITARDAPLGWLSEAAAIDLSSATAREFSISKDNTEMKIYADLVNVSDFTQRAGQGFMNIRETTLGTRVAAHAQHKEQTFLYGDPSQALSDGSPGDTNAFQGLSLLYPKTIKTTTSISGDKAMLKDIKKEISLLRQSAYNISASDLQVWCSHTAFNWLADEMQVATRIVLPDSEFNFGFEGIRIDGVPVIPSHNVATHTYGSYTPGKVGDVFLYNKRATQWFGLAPLSTVPLGRVGLADRAALYEYGVLHERAGGVFGKYLYDYQVS